MNVLNPNCDSVQLMIAICLDCESYQHVDNCLSKKCSLRNDGQSECHSVVLMAYKMGIFTEVTVGVRELLLNRAQKVNSIYNILNIRNALSCFQQPEK